MGRASSCVREVVGQTGVEYVEELLDILYHCYTLSLHIVASACTMFGFTVLVRDEGEKWNYVVVAAA
jgi:hypothetical protein